MKVKDFDDFGHPNRRPGLVILLVIAVIIALVIIINHSDRTQAESQDESEPITDMTSSPVSNNMEQVTVAQPAVSQNLRQRFESAVSLVSSDQLEEARKQLLELLDDPGVGSLLPKIEAKIAEVSIPLITKPYLTEEKVEYVVRSGDSLDKISKKFKTTQDLIKVSNKIQNANLIHVGDALRVLNGEFKIRVDKSDFDLVLTLNDKFVKRYNIGTGAFDKTPIGTFVITEKEKNPVWWKDGKPIEFGDPRNVLGTRWMAIRATGDTPPVKGYGIHGTTEDDTIGQAKSAGCVRMHNWDVEELFLLVPIGTTITIQE
jgi:lipoprotein-anchoring transpeptidase ErfK/SrfK